MKTKHPHVSSIIDRVCTISAYLSACYGNAMQTHTTYPIAIIQQNSYINRKTESALLFISVSER